MWGQVESIEYPYPGNCDFDGGGVGITDFVALLSHWGGCP